MDGDTLDAFQKSRRPMTKSRGIKGATVRPIAPQNYLSQLVKPKKNIAPVPEEVNPGIHDGTRNKMKRIKGVSRERGLRSSDIPCSRIETSAISAMQDANGTYHIQSTLNGKVTSRDNRLAPGCSDQRAEISNSRQPDTEHLQRNSARDNKLNSDDEAGARGS